MRVMGSMGVKWNIIHPVLPSIKAVNGPFYLKPIFCLCFMFDLLWLLRTYLLLILFFDITPGLAVVLMIPSSWHTFITDPCKILIFLSPLSHFISHPSPQRQPLHFVSMFFFVFVCCISQGSSGKQNK